MQTGSKPWCYIKKIKPPTFIGETEKGEEAKSWMSGMKKHFQIYNYSNQLKARMAIYNLTGKADIWWQDLKRVKCIRKRTLTGVHLRNILKAISCQNSTMKSELRNFIFKKYFKKKFLSKQYL